MVFILVHPYLVIFGRYVEHILYKISLVILPLITLDMSMDPLSMVLSFRFFVLLYLQLVVYRVVVVVLKVLEVEVGIIVEAVMGLLN